MRVTDTLPIQSRAAAESSRQIVWLDSVLPLLLMLVCFVAGISAIGLVGPDEPRYASIARAMARTGDWITPRLNGLPWFEKPALYYWMAGAAWRIFGESEFAMRLPSVLSAVLAVLAASWAALRAFGLDAARLTLIMLPVSVGLIGFSHSAAGDMPFAALLMACAAVAAEMLMTARPRATTLVLFGFLLGLATLAKGPAAILLAGASVLLWSIIAGRVGSSFRFFHPACVAAFAATAVPWYALCAARNPDFVNVFFVQHNFQRYLTPVFQHPQPFWFFVPVLLGATFPWMALTLPLLVDAVRAPKSAEWRNSPALFFACWVIAPLAFFSFSESKLPGYILPAAPPLVLLLAWTLSRRLDQTPASARLWIGITACTLPLLGLFLRFGLNDIPRESGLARPSAWMPLFAIATLGGLICVVLAWSRRTRAAIAGLAVVIALLAGMAAISILPRLDPYLSARRAAAITRDLVPTSGALSTLGIDRSLQYGLEYYLARPLPEWNAHTPDSTWLWTPQAWEADLARTPGLNCTVLYKLSDEAWLVRIDVAGS